jgi:hypothetical protein
MTMADSIQESSANHAGKLKISTATKNYHMVFTVLTISKWYAVSMVK